MELSRIKTRLRAAYGTSCYVCGAQKSRMGDVAVLWFDGDKGQEESNAYLACRTCAAKIRKRPLAAYVTEQRARCAAELERLGQIELWHSVGRNMSATNAACELHIAQLQKALAKAVEPKPRIRDTYSDGDMRLLLESAKKSGVSKRVIMPIWARASSLDTPTSNAAMEWLIELCETESAAAD